MVASANNALELLHLNVLLTNNILWRAKLVSVLIFFLDVIFSKEQDHQVALTPEHVGHLDKASQRKHNYLNSFLADHVKNGIF